MWRRGRKEALRFGKRSKNFFRVGFAVLAMPVYAATVHVTVGGIRNARGHVLVALCPRETFLQPHCALQGRAPAQRGTVLVTIENVPPGLYAAQAFHDEDDNGRLERSFLGMPEEGMGFSRDAPMRFGPPDFDAAMFKVENVDVSIGFGLRYY
jgi:uncharacterized protein (DUF2141 family)